MIQDLNGVVDQERETGDIHVKLESAKDHKNK